MKTSSRTRGSRSARSAAASTSSSSAIASISTPDRAGRRRTRRRAPRGRDRPRAMRAKPPPWRSSMTLGSAAPGQVVARLGDVGRDDEDGCREPRVIERREPIVRGERLGEVRAEAVRRRAPAATRSYRASVGRRPRADGAAARTRSRSRVTPRAAKSSSHASTRRAKPAVPGQRCRRRGPRARRTRADRASRARPPRRPAAPATPRPTRAPDRARRRRPRVSQLPSSCATPPGARCAPTPRDEGRDEVVARPCPPSRYS